jgi:ubiquinone/menaquinone biosynthesis C-methylase UbiE
MDHGASRPAQRPEVTDVFERAAGSYDQTGVRFYGPLGRRLVDSAGLTPGMEVLDVGCGRGACTFPAAEAVGPGGSVTGIDAAHAMIEAARRTAAELPLDNVTLAIGDAVRPDLPPESFDAVLAGLVVFLLPDPATALRSYHGLLRPGGRLAMSSFGVVDPRFFQVTDVMLRFLPEPPTSIPGQGDSAFGSQERLAALVADAGFEDVKVTDSYLDLEFADTGQWWDWLWQTAGRMILESVPEDRLPEAREAAMERMEEVRDEHGRLSIRWNVWLTNASKAHTGPAGR